MYIWSIDVGHVRIGLAILEVADCHLGNIKRYIQHRKKRNHIDKMKWENVKIVSMQTFSAWDTDVSKPNKKTISETCIVVARCLLKRLHESAHKPTAIFIERQIKRFRDYGFSKNASIQFFIQGFLSACPGVQLVYDVPATMKMTRHALYTEPAAIFADCPTVEEAKKFTKYQRKRAAVRASKCWCAFLTYSGGITSSADDADALLQSIAILSAVGFQ